MLQNNKKKIKEAMNILNEIVKEKQNRSLYETLFNKNNVIIDNNILSLQYKYFKLTWEILI